MKYLFLGFLAFTISLSSLAQKREVKRELRAYLDNKQFYAPGIGNYVEYQLQFVGHSLNYKGKDNGLIGEVAVQMSVNKGEEIVASDAYRLSTPFMKDSIVEDFYDVKRFMLEPGNYTFNIKLEDLNNDNPPLEASQEIVIEDLSNAISISDIQIAESATKGDGTSPFYKSGYDIIPRLSTFYPAQLSSIPVYFEMYNTQQFEDSVFAIKQTIVDANQNKELEIYTTLSRHYTAEVVPFIRNIDIAQIPTGKYVLNFTLLNRNMTELSTQSYVFDRSNEILQNVFSDEIQLDPAFQESIKADSVGYYLESLIPICGSNETKNIFKIAKERNSEKARKYIQLFWAKTAPENPYEGWIKYKVQVDRVEELFANNFQEGFETDRGRVFLQYGAPTRVIDRNMKNPSEYPYEIWEYDKIGRFSNKRFIFYNPDLTNNAHRLLHSDMLGEISNRGWQQALNSRNTTRGNVDNPNENVIDHWGGNSDELFRQY